MTSAHIFISQVSSIEKSEVNAVVIHLTDGRHFRFLGAASEASDLYVQLSEKLIDGTDAVSVRGDWIDQSDYPVEISSRMAPNRNAAAG